MANYIEQATLSVRDEARPVIRRINRELASLFRMARRGTEIRLRHDSITDALRETRRLRDSLRSLSTRDYSLRVRLDSTGEVMDDIRELRGRIENTVASMRIRLDGTGGVMDDIRELRGRIENTVASMRIRLDGEGGLRDDIRELRARVEADDIRIRISFPGLDASIVQLRTLNAELTQLRGQSANINIRTPGRVNAAGNQVPSYSPYGLSFSQGLSTAFNPGVIGRRMGVSFSYAVQGELAYLFRSVAGAALTAPLDLDTARARVRTAGRTEEERILLESYAADASRDFPASSTAEILANAVEVTGTLGEITTDPVAANNARLAMLRVAESSQILAATLGIGSEQAAEFARRTEKTVQILGAAGDPVEASAIQQAVLRAVIASGGDLNPSEVVRAMQHSGGTFRAGISEMALLQVALLRDEGGRMSTAEVRMAFQDMTRGNLNRDDMAAQRAVGLRDAEGRGVYADRFQENPLEVVRNVIIPMLQQLNVDMNDAQAVATALDNDLGFTTTGVRFFAAAIHELDQREAEVARAMEADLSYPAENPTVRQRAAQVNAQFANLSSVILEPLLGPVGEGLNTLQASLNALSRGEAGIGDIGAAMAATIPIGMYAGLEGMQNADSRPLAAAGLSLTSSAVALHSAAAALTGAAVVEGVNDMAGGGGRRGWLRLIGALSIPTALAAGASYFAQSNEETIEQLIERGTQDRLIDHLNTTRAAREAREAEHAERLRGPGAFELPNGGRATPFGSGQIQAEEISRYLSESSDEMWTTFTTGADGIAQAGETIVSGGDDFGMMAANALLAAAPGFGSAIASAIAGAVSNINVNVPAPRAATPRLDTGTTGPQ